MFQDKTSFKIRFLQDFDCVSLRIPFDAPPTQKYSPEVPLSFIPIIMIHYVLKLTALPGSSLLLEPLLTYLPSLFAPISLAN